MRTTKQPLPSHAETAFTTSRLGGNIVPSGAMSWMGGFT